MEGELKKIDNYSKLNSIEIRKSIIEFIIDLCENTII